MSVISIRLMAIIPHILSIFVFGLLGLGLGGGYVFLALLGIFYNSNSILHYVSLEGRSMALANLTLGIFLHSLIEAVKRRCVSSQIYLAIATYIFLSSIGLQPIYLVGFAMVASLLCSYLNKENHSPTFAMLAAILLFLPAQYVITRMAELQGYFHSGALYRLFSLPADFPAFSLTFWGLGNQAPAVIFTWVSLLAGAAIALPKHRLGWALSLAFFLLYPPAFEWGYGVLINWKWSFRYTTCFVALVVFACSLGFSLLPKIPRFVFLVGFLVFSFFVQQRDANYQLMVYFREDWSQLYREIAAVPREHDRRLYMTGPCDLTTSWWCQSILVGPEFLIHNARPQLTYPENKLSSINDNGMLYDFTYPLKDKHHLTAVIGKSASHSRLPSEQLPARTDSTQGFSARRIGDFIVVESNAPMETREGITSLLTWMVTNLSQGQDLVYPFELLIRLNVSTGNMEKARYWHEQLLAHPKIKADFTTHPRGQALRLELQQLLEASE